MAQNWLVSFFDKAGNTIHVQQVNCYEAARACTLAIADMKRRKHEKLDPIMRYTHSIRVDDA